MSSQFDPYTRWLEIDVEDRPPNHYDLLGLQRFESDVERIDAAYRSRYALVRKYQVGEKSSYALQLVTELSKAHDCLSDSSLRSSYDRQLRGDAPADEDATNQLVEVRKKPLADGKLDLKQQLTDIGSQQPGAVLDGETETNVAPDTAGWDDSEADVAGIGDASPGTAEAIAVPPPQAVWHLKTPDGLRFGPMTEQELDYQVQQGSVSAACQIFREGWDRPRWARDLYTGLYDSESEQIGGRNLGTASQFSPGAATGPSGPPVFQSGVTPSSVAPYKMLDPHGTLRGSKLIFAGGMALLGFGLFVVVIALARFTFLSVMAATAGTVGVVALVVGLLEASWLFNSPPAAIVRGQFGDRTTRNMIVTVGTMLLLLSYLVLGLQAGAGIYRVMASAKQTGGGTAQIRKRGGNSKDVKSQGGGTKPKNSNGSTTNSNASANSKKSNGSNSQQTKKRTPMPGDNHPARQEQWRIAYYIDGANTAMRFSPRGHLFVADPKGIVHRWHLTLKRWQSPIKDHGCRVVDFAVRGDGRQMMIVGDDSALHQIDLDTSREVKKLPDPLKDYTRTAPARFVYGEQPDSWAYSAGKGISIHNGSSDRLLPGSRLNRVVALDYRRGHLAFAGDEGAACWRNGSLVRPDLPSDAATSIAVQPTGNLIAIGKSDGHIALWDVAKGTLHQWDQKHSQPVSALAFSADGRRLVSGSGAGDILVWHVEIHREWLCSFDPETGPVHSLAFDQSGRTFFVSGPKKTTAIEMGTSSDNAKSYAMAADAVATLGTPGTTKSDPNRTPSKANGNSPAEKWQIVRRLELGERAYALAFAPDGASLAASGSRSTALWPVAAAGDKKLLDQPVANTRALAWSADGRFLAAGGRSAIRIWDARDWQVLRDLTSPDPEAVRTLAFTPNGAVLAAGSQLRKTVQLWKVDDGTMFSDFLVNPRGVNKLEFRPGNNELAVAGGDANLRLYDAQQGKELKQWPGRFLGTVRDVAVSKNGELLATANSDGKIRVWGRTDEAHDKSWRAPIGSRAGGFNVIAFHPDSRILAAAIVGDNKVTLWDASSGKQLGQFEGHTRPIQVIAFSPDGRFFASADDRGQILIHGSK